MCVITKTLILSTRNLHQSSCDVTAIILLAAVGIRFPRRVVSRRGDAETGRRKCALDGGGSVFP